MLIGLDTQTLAKKVQEINLWGRYAPAAFQPGCLLHPAHLVGLADLLHQAQPSLQASPLSSCSVQDRPRNLYSTSAATLLIHLTHLQVVIGTLSVVAGRLNPEQVPEVDPDKVAVLCRYHPGEVAVVERAATHFVQVMPRG